MKRSSSDGELTAVAPTVSPGGYPTKSASTHSAAMGGTTTVHVHAALRSGGGGGGLSSSLDASQSDAVKDADRHPLRSPLAPSSPSYQRSIAGGGSGGRGAAGVCLPLAFAYFVWRYLKLVPSATREAFAMLRTIKGAVLVILVAQSSLGLLLTRYTRARPVRGPEDTPLFSVPCAVMCTEAIKLFVCFWWVFLTESPPQQQQPQQQQQLSHGQGPQHQQQQQHQSASATRCARSNAALSDSTPSPSPPPPPPSVADINGGRAAHQPSLLSPVPGASCPTPASPPPSAVPCDASVGVNGGGGGGAKAPAGVAVAAVPTLAQQHTQQRLIRLFTHPSRFGQQCAFVLRTSLLHRDTWHMLPPSLLFTFQSNIIYVALQNVEVTLFQVLYQSKLLLTALFVGYAFNRSFNRLQWASLFFLFIGVVISQLGASAGGGGGGGSTSGSSVPSSSVVVSSTTPFPRLAVTAVTDGSGPEEKGIDGRGGSDKDAAKKAVLSLSLPQQTPLAFSVPVAAIGAVKDAQKREEYMHANGNDDGAAAADVFDEDGAAVVAGIVVNDVVQPGAREAKKKANGITEGPHMIRIVADNGAESIVVSAPAAVGPSRGVAAAAAFTNGGIADDGCGGEHSCQKDGAAAAAGAKVEKGLFVTIIEKANEKDGHAQPRSLKRAAEQGDLLAVAAKEGNGVAAQHLARVEVGKNSGADSVDNVALPAIDNKVRGRGMKPAEDAGEEAGGREKTVDTKPSPSSAAASSSFVGIAALLSASVSSAIAAVVMEKVLKDRSSPQSLAVRNVQLAVFSLGLSALVQYGSALTAAASSSPPPSSSLLTSALSAEVGGGSGSDSGWDRPYPPPLLHGLVGDFFLGFDGYVWALVTNQAAGGILVALVLRYADNILKGFAVAACIFICGLFSRLAWGTHLAPGFVLGATIVTISVITYSVASS